MAILVIISAIMRSYSFALKNHHVVAYYTLSITRSWQFSLINEDWKRNQHTKSLIWIHTLHSQSNHGRCCWIFYKSLSNYNGRLRIMQHVMLTSAPYSCFIRQYPAEKERGEDRQGERERERGMTCGFILGFFVSMRNQREALTEMWQIPAMSKTGRLAHILICQVR